jgi:hypothetical protein
MARAGRATSSRAGSPGGGRALCHTPDPLEKGPACSPSAAITPVPVLFGICLYRWNGSWFPPPAPVDREPGATLLTSVPWPCYAPGPRTDLALQDAPRAVILRGRLVHHRAAG